MTEQDESTPSRLHGHGHARARKSTKLAGLASERDFYRYYPQSAKQNDVLSRQPSPPSVPAPDEPAIEPPQLDALRSSEDTALAAFAQLGALRLNAKRCLISFFDRKSCYILAEATKTTSLHNGQPEFADDVLCFGTSIFPKEMSLCHYTVNLAWTNCRGPADAYENHPSLVVNDLSKDLRFKDYPFVSGPPYSRFYAGVPIRSRFGHSIGTYCVLDDKPRDGLGAHELVFLKNMARTIMRHLEMSRATEDQRRGKIMVKSLGSFAEGKTGLDNWWSEPWDPVNEQPAFTRSPNNAFEKSSDATMTTTMVVQDGAITERDGSAESSLHSVISPCLTSRPTSMAGTPATENVPDIHTELITKTSSSTIGEGKDGIAPELRATFNRAANMIVDATEAEGVAFFDAKISTFGGLVDDDFSEQPPPEQDKPCAVLGSALCRTNRDCPNLQISISESVLRHLLRTYPHGQIFNLDDDVSSPAFNSPCGNLEGETLDGFPFAVSRQSESVRSFDDENYLRSIFPRARSLVMYPQWDAHRDRWFSCVIVWSSDPLRVFTSEQELSYLAAFSNSVMAEIARLDTRMADAAKADFISSISHELRSPLHGILGMTDLLKDSSIDNQQISHVATIEVCGKTLLETINHVLDFAKINNLTRGASKPQKKRTHSAKQIISSGQAHTNDIMTIISDVDIATLTEDVVESVFAGYTYQKSSAHNYDLIPPKADTPSVSVILDINQSANYVFRTQPGAWRRVIMNLFGNSLKYTPAGYIKVKLEVKRPKQNQEECCEFRFTVTDSGIGMSEDYVNNRLFHSFAQENALSQGTGLGLSIVKQIVESLGGEVEVRSEKGRGTKFTVTCPLKASAMSPLPGATGLEHEKEQQLIEVKKRTRGLRVRFVGFEAEGEDHFVKDLKNKTANKLSLKALENLCTEWFGMQSKVTTTEVDLIIATEHYAKLLRAQYSKDHGAAFAVPVIVVCPGAAAAQSTTAITVPGIIFECISQPVGPHKMAKALSSSLDRHTNRILEQSTETDTTLQKVMHLDLKENTLPLRPALVTRTSEQSRPALPSANSAPELGFEAIVPLRKSIYSKPTRSLNCLCVDDNPINLRLLRTFVHKLGHRHILAADGLEALGAYKSAQTGRTSLTADEAYIDVILMDINMPVMDGLESTRQIRAHEIRANLPKVTIIALTGVADSGIQQEANVSGVNLFLIKPVRLAHLEVVLNGVITGQENEKQSIEQELSKRDSVTQVQKKEDVAKGAIIPAMIESTIHIQSNEHEDRTPKHALPVDHDNDKSDVIVTSLPTRNHSSLPPVTAISQ